MHLNICKCRSASNVAGLHDFKLRGSKQLSYANADFTRTPISNFNKMNYANCLVVKMANK